jgi:hypothetical protein
MPPYNIPFLFDYVFANIVLPNAINPELAVINYFHTLHSNKLRSESLFDGRDSLSNKTALTFIFDESIGTWPTSLRNNGSHLVSDCFKPYINYREDSLFYGKKQFRKYIYPIKLTPHFEQFVGLCPAGSKLNGEFFWKNMSMEALTDVREGNAVILLDFMLENFVEKTNLINLHEVIKFGRLPKKSVILAINSFNAEEVYNSWFAENDRWLDVKSVPYLTSNVSCHFKSSPTSRMTLRSFKETEEKLRKNYFIYKIRRPREHRVALLYKLYSEGLLEKADWSCLESFHPYSPSFIKEKYNFSVNEQSINELMTRMPRTLESEPLATSDNVSGWGDTHANAHLNSYFYVCTESYVESDYESITEKIYKPIINFQPFIFFSFPGALKVLRKIGFKTFSPWINEDYDNEHDLKIRSNLIFNEIQRLCCMNKEELHEWYWSMREVLEHNHTHFLEFYKNDSYSLNFVEYLFRRISI